MCSYVKMLMQMDGDTKVCLHGCYEYHVIMDTWLFHSSPLHRAITALNPFKLYPKLVSGRAHGGCQVIFAATAAPLSIL
jgi:hypothetical protein